MRIPRLFNFLYKFDFFNTMMVFTRLDKAHIESETEHSCTGTIDHMVRQLPEHDRTEIGRLPQGNQSSQNTVVAKAAATFDKIIGYEQTDLNKWKSEYEKDLENHIKERESRRKERDNIERTKADQVDRVLPFTPSEKFEFFFLIFVAILLWVFGYFSMVELIKSLDTPLTPLAIILLPAAGVTVMAFSIKMLLSMFKGGRFYKAALVGCMVLAFASALGWLFFFSEFIQISSQEVQFQSLDSLGKASPEDGHTGMVYVIMTVLAEALGAASAWSYASYMLHTKTIRSHGTNPEWQAHDEMFLACDGLCEELERRIALCDSLHAKIEAARKEYVASAVIIYQGNP